MSLAGRLVVVLALGLAWLGPVSSWLATPWVVVGRSMAPALLDGERVLVDRWSYEHRAPRPGEVTLVRLPDGRIAIKRIGRTSADGRIWVYGDNPDESADSRRFGPLPAAAVRGRVVVRWWPPGRLGPVGHQSSFSGFSGHLRRLPASRESRPPAGPGDGP